MFSSEPALRSNETKLQSSTTSATTRLLQQSESKSNKVELEDACCLRREHNRWSYNVAWNCALAVCCKKEGDTMNLFNYIAMMCCCFGPARCITSARYCPSDSWWRTKNSTAFCCSLTRVACCGTNKPEERITIADCGTTGYSCDEDELEGYSRGGLSEALRTRHAPTTQTMS